MHRTPKHQLAEALLGTSLLEWISERRSSGKSWAQISLELRDATKVTITGETLRAWHLADQDSKAGAV